MKQHEAVIVALEKLGGLATLGQLNGEVLKVPGCEWKTKTPFASIRRIVQLRKEIYRIKPGLYGLASRRPAIEARGILAETPKNRRAKEVVESNHTYYQGVLLLMGKLREQETFAPNQDRNKPFLNGSIAQVRTLAEIPPFSYPELVRRSQSVDATWFNERRMPSAFFEVEFTTDFQNSLVKFADLQDFAAQMRIVADASRCREFRAKVDCAAFKDIRERVEFLDFNSLVQQYEALTTASAGGVVL